MTDIEHGPHCPQPYRGACLKFSTDGTRLGIDVAHIMSTDDETKIVDIGMSYLSSATDGDMTGMNEEMMDWLGMDLEEYHQYLQECRDRGFDE